MPKTPTLIGRLIYVLYDKDAYSEDASRVQIKRTTLDEAITYITTLEKQLAEARTALGERLVDNVSNPE